LIFFFPAMAILQRAPIKRVGELDDSLGPPRLRSHSSVCGEVLGKINNVRHPNRLGEEIEHRRIVGESPTNTMARSSASMSTDIASARRRRVMVSLVVIAEPAN